MAAHSLGPGQHLLPVMNWVSDSLSGGGFYVMRSWEGCAAALPSSTAAEHGKSAKTLCFFLESSKLFPCLSTPSSAWLHPAYATCF